MEMVSTITSLITNVVNFAGGLLLLFGAVTLGTNLKDHNGPGISSGAWSIAGGVLIICLLSQICFVFDNSNLQHIRTFPMGFAFFLFCHHSTKCDKQCQKDFQEHLCIFSVTAKGASAKADAPFCVSCAF